jgi:tRNA/rRNA methyltransferase
MTFNNISFILHQPQLSENIGACARAIKNFNFKKLVIVKPRPIFPNDKILATSVGAKDLIVNAKVYKTLESAVKKVDYKNIKHISLNDLKKIDFDTKVAFLFGSEASGLSNNEISYANYTMQIPTNPDFKSLNLSHSVIIIAHTVASIINLKVAKYSVSKKVSLASKGDVQAMTNLCVNKLEEKNFFKPREKRPIMLENLRSIFSKMELSKKETRILSSVFASLAKKG